MAANRAMYLFAPMMGKNLLKIIVLLSLQLAAAAPSSLEQVRELIAAKKTTEAVAILKADHARLVRGEKDFKNVNQWLSLFLYENSMELYEKAEELAPTDPSGAKEQFEALLEKEPNNKVAMCAYLKFLIEQKKWGDAKAFAEKSAALLPYFPIFSVYKSLIALNQNEATVVVICDKKAMTSVEAELCQLAHLIAKVQSRDPKKKVHEQELKNLAGRSTIPDAHYWLWKATQNLTHLRTYVKHCHGLTEKYKKNYRIVPDLCAKMREAESQLEPKPNDETNAS